MYLMSRAHLPFPMLLLLQACLVMCLSMQFEAQKLLENNALNKSCFEPRNTSEKKSTEPWAKEAPCTLPSHWLMEDFCSHDWKTQKTCGTLRII